jgi:hypothetical protein
MMSKKASLVAIATLLLGSSSARAGGWQAAHQPHRKLSRQMVAAKMKADGVKRPHELLAHRYLVRVGIRNTGGGPATHSEVAVRFRVLPQKAVAKAWADRKERNRAQLGGYSRCKVKRSKGTVRSVGRTCPVKFNGRGFVDVTKAFTERNILFVHDPAKPKKASSIVWVATDEPQKRIWYYVIPGARKIEFGFGKLTIDKYEIEPKAAEDQPSGATDTSSDPAGSGETDPGSADPETADPETAHPPERSREVRPVEPPVSRWQPTKTAHTPIDRSVLEQKMRSDGVPNPRYLLKHRYVVRFGIANTGGGSSSYSELIARFDSRPKRAVGKAWADRNDLGRAQMGAPDSCRRRTKRKDALKKAHWCPVHFNGLGWRDLTKAFTSKKVLLINDPNNTGQGGVLIWAAFDRPQPGLMHRVPPGLVGPSFGLGTVKVAKYEVRGSVRTSPHPSPSPSPQPAPNPSPEEELKPPFPADESTPGRTRDPAHPRRAPRGARGTKKWKREGRRLITAPTWKIMRYVNRDRLRGGRTLLRYPYLVRVQLRSTGGGTGRRSEVGFRFASPIAKVYGKAWADSPQMGRAQIGLPRKCRTGLYKNLPAGWRTCPVHFNNLGWRNLSSSVAGKKRMLLINQPGQPNKAHTVLWLAFRRDPGPILVRRYEKAGRYTLKSGRLHVLRLRVQRRGGRYPGRPRYRRRPAVPPSDHGPGDLPPEEEPRDGYEDDYEGGYEGEPAGGQRY